MAIASDTSCYLVSYDVADGTADEYAALAAAIKSYGKWAHITESTWAVVTSRPATEIRDHLGAFVSPQSRIFVVRTASGAAWRNVICRNTWLKENLG